MGHPPGASGKTLQACSTSVTIRAGLGGFKHRNNQETEESPRYTDARLHAFGSARTQLNVEEERSYMRLRLILAMLVSTTLLIVAMPSQVNAATVFLDDGSEPTWAQNAPTPTRWNQYGAPCYTRMWGKLLYKTPAGKESWRQQLLPDCDAVRYESPFSVTSKITVTEGGITTSLQYRSRLGSAAAPDIEKDYNIIVGQRYQDGHSKGYQAQTKARTKGSSEIDFAHASTVRCTQDSSKKFSLNPKSWVWSDVLTVNRKCNSFQQPITAVRSGKVIACSLSEAKNFQLKKKTNFIVVEVSGNSHRPLGKMFANVPISKVKHYDVYVHVDGLRSTSEKLIKVDDVAVGTSVDAWCNRIKGKSIERGQVLGLLASTNSESPHLHLETVVCTKAYTGYVTDNWKADKSGINGCRWNRPYWKARVSTQDVNELPRKEFSYAEEGLGNSGWGSLQPPYTEDWKP